jgi:hypothetical protein
LKDIRNTSAAASVLYGIANAHLGLKRQFVQKMRDDYLEETKRYELFQSARQAGTVPPRQIFDLTLDLQSLSVVHSPEETLQRLLFDQISLSAAEILVAPLVLSSLKYLAKAISDRNDLVADWRKNRPAELETMYLGVAGKSGIVDKRYPMTVEAIYSQTNDVIAFSIMLADSLYERAKEIRQRFRRRFRVDGPPINRMDFARYGNLLPPAADYKHFTDMFDRGDAANQPNR